MRSYDTTELFLSLLFFFWFFFAFFSLFLFFFFSLSHEYASMCLHVYTRRRRGERSGERAERRAGKETRANMRGGGRRISLASSRIIDRDCPVCLLLTFLCARSALEMLWSTLNSLHGSLGNVFALGAFRVVTFVITSREVVVMISVLYPPLRSLPLFPRTASRYIDLNIKFPALGAVNGGTRRPSRA